MKDKLAFILLGLASPFLILPLITGFLVLPVYIFICRIIKELEEDAKPFRGYQMD